MCIQLLGALLEICRDNVTSIRWGGCCIEDVSMRQGVKQGYLISPWIFNAVLDELLYSLPSWLGVSVDGKNIASIMYADNIVLYGESCACMQQLLRQVEEFFGELGMTLNAEKCTAFSIEVAGHVQKMAVVGRPIFQVSGSDIRSVNVHQYLKYLGTEIGLVGGYAEAHQISANL